MIGKTISHYRILEKLGEGGMGVVYKAVDETLRRAVALKFLSPRILGTQEHTARLMHEARAAAALDHQNICTVHEVSEEDGQPFIVMSLIEGESLRDRTKRGPLSPEEAIDIASQVAAGLAAAHEVGVIHRDVNPRNIMITPKGQVKIMDFGLAVSAEMTKLTQPGKTAGTTAYMSPEQARGIGVDHRTDIWALGVVLHEITTGHRAFKGDSDQAIIYSILNEDPPLPSKLRPELPAGLDAVVAKAIAKRTEDRYQSMEELLEDLRALAQGEEVTATIPARVRRYGISRFARPWVSWLGLAAVVALAVVAVRMFLPPGGAVEELTEQRVFVATFENRTGDPSLDHIGQRAATSISEGVAQEDIAEVLAHEAEDAAGGGGGQGSAAGLLSEARRAGASVLVAGSFHVQSDSLRMEARLLDVSDGTVLNVIPDQIGPLAAPAAAIEKTRSRVMGALAVRSDPRIMRDARSYAPTWEAYQEYAAGFELWGVELGTAFEHWERALQLDPGFKTAQTTAWLNQALVLTGSLRHAEADSLLRDVLSRPGTLTPHERLSAEAMAAVNRGDYSEALRKARELVPVEPEFSFAKRLLAENALRLNRPREAVDACRPLLDRAHQTDTQAEHWVYDKLLIGYHMLEEFERQLEIAKEAIEIFPDDRSLREREITALAGLGRAHEIDRIIEESASTPVGRDWHFFFGSSVFAMRMTAVNELDAHGHTQEAATRAEDLVEWQRRRTATAADVKWARWQLAWALYRAERWEEARALFEQLEPPLANLDLAQRVAIGCAAARLGDRATALEIKQTLLERDVWTEAGYNVGLTKYFAGSIAAVLGEREEAMDLVQAALAEGNDIWDYLHFDQDYAVLRDYPPFQRLLEPKD